MAEITQVIWSDEPGDNVEHLAEHGVTADEAEAVIRRCFEMRERSTSYPAYWTVAGFTPAGRYLRVVFAYLAELDIVIPVTAYEPEPER